MNCSPTVGDSLFLGVDTVRRICKNQPVAHHKLFKASSILDTKQYVHGSEDKLFFLEAVCLRSTHSEVRTILAFTSFKAVHFGVANAAE